MIDSIETTGQKTDPLWYSPLYVFSYVNKLVEKGYSIDELDIRFKQLRESKLLAVLALALCEKMNNITLFQPVSKDPPDGYLAQQSKVVKGQLDISTVEITHYYGINFKGNGNESLLDQLIKSGKIAEKSKYSDHYILAVELLTKEGVNYDEIREYVNDIKLPYPIWTIKKLRDAPDTIAEVIIINPKTNRMEINVGKSAFYYSGQKIPNVTKAIMVKDPSEVRTERTNEVFAVTPPWEIDEKKLLRFNKPNKRA